MIPLHAIGYWRSPTWRILFPHPKEVIERVDRMAHRPRVVEYLRSGVVVCRMCGYSYCRFKGGPPDEEMGDGDLSDGVWVWPQGLPIYVERYHVRLPEDFLNHVANNGFVVPTVANPDTLLSRTYSYKQWLDWSQAVRSNRTLAMFSKFLIRRAER